MSKIISIGTAVPKYGSPQNDILSFMQTAYQNDAASRKLKVLFHQSGIDKRYSVVSDFTNSHTDNAIFDIDKPAPNVEERLTVFKMHATSLAIEAIHNSLKKINTTVADFKVTHLITVTCTGLYAPGIDTEIIEELHLPDDIFRTSINFMGCNAAFHALKIADLIGKTDENANILVVCLELCTLHFQPKDNNDNLLSNTIFGDGAAAVLVVSDKAAKQNQQKGLEMKGFYSLLLDKGKDYMGWNIKPLNFEMILDPIIPDFIGNHTHEIVSRAGKNLNITRSTIDKWAVHPGGKKILDAVKKQLELSDNDLKHSYKVLAEYGNMSSPTILFVLNEIMQSNLTSNETVFAIGFGPGLSIETAKFNYAE
jgi:predicted naringenin-chalcone synthase